MKIFFSGAFLDHEVDRLGGVGLAKASTCYFRTAGHGPVPISYTIELDTDVGLVTISNGKGGAIVVPRERVLHFEPLPQATPTHSDEERRELEAESSERGAAAKRGPGRPRKDAQGDA